MRFARFALGLIAASASLAQAAETTPHWIAAGRDGRSGLLERRFEVLATPPAATIRVAADFCRAVVELNGQRVLSLEPFAPTAEIDVTPHLRKGENRLTIEMGQPCGPCAVALDLMLEHADRRQTHLVTDANWTAGGSPAADRGEVPAELWGVGRRSTKVDPFENYEQWRIAAAGAKAGDVAFSTAPGFEVALVRQATEQEGSWIGMAFDPQGRLTISREDRGLLRMTLVPDSSQVTKVETINEDLQECRGLLYAYGALYANANNNKGLYRLRDLDGDDRFDEVQLLREFPGRVGHGRNDLLLGHDGMIYSIHGDSVELPSQDVADRTSPFRDARRGRTTSEGYLIRTDRDGKNWEIVCAGLRNPYGIGMHPSGDLFTYDADAEFDMGTPWYRPTRVVQLRSGADFGWRGVTGQWPPYYADHPDNALPTLDIGRGSPTAAMFGTSSNFPAPYREALFILDWAYGRMLAVHLKPRGAGYRAAAEVFLQGRPLNLTDLAFGPDGAMYLITGGRKTQSALYRVVYRGEKPAPRAASQHERECAEHAAEARAIRERLESFQGRVVSEAIETAWPHLDHSDPAIRYAAQTAIEHQPLAAWRDRALSEQRVTASLGALTALLRSGNRPLVPSVVDRLAMLEATSLDLEQQRLLLNAYSLAATLDADAVTARKAKIAAQWRSPGEEHGLRLGVSGGGDARQERARLLAQFDAPHAVERISQSLLHSPQQEDRLQALLLLRNVREGWTLERRKEYFAALNEMPRFVAGEGMPKFVAHLQEDSQATLSERERTELADLLKPASEPAMSEPLPSRPLVKKWALADFSASALAAGDARRGEHVFRDAQCARCHRLGAWGPAVGPDLSFVARRFSRRDMLESILTPSQVVAEHYRSVQVVTKDGRTLLGRVLIEGDYRSETLRIAADPLRPALVVELNKRDVAEYRLSDVSPMPSGLLDGFQAGEIVDLLAYLEQGQGATARIGGK